MCSVYVVCVARSPFSPPQASPTLVVNHFTMANVLAAQVGGVALVTGVLPWQCFSAYIVRLTA